MAKESIDLPMITEVTMSSGVGLRRHSAGVAISGNNEKKVVPHYLRASTGSCHDFCKYGRKHVQEAKEKLTMTKRDGKKPLHRSSEDAKPKASIDSEPTKMSTVKHTKSDDLSTKSSGSQKQIGNEVQVNKSKASFHPKSHIFPITKTRRQGISSSLEVETPSKPTFKRVETSPISTSPLGPTSERVKTHPKSTFQMVKASSKSTSKMKQTSSKVSSFEDKEMNLSEKHVTSLNPDSVTVQTISSMNSSEGFGGQRNSEIKMKKSEASCKVASSSRTFLSSKPSCKKIASINARKHKGLKIVSLHKNQPKSLKVEPEEHNNEAQEKTLYVIKMESANQTLQSDQNESQDSELSLSNSLSSPKFSLSSISESSSKEDQEKSEYATSKSEDSSSSSGNHEIEYMETLEVEENGKPQKDEIVCSEDKNFNKLRGELEDTQIEKSSPRRLKFRRGKVFEDNATEVKVGADNVSAITGPEKVVLRHQDVQVKKDEQGLYNIVIEETASKLVETQKSKVKALVGAFETVISLQEKRNCANFVN